MRTLKLFLISSCILGLLYHFVTRERMPWWPDTAILGAFTGGMVTLIYLGIKNDIRGDRRLATALVRGWRAWRG